MNKKIIFINVLLFALIAVLVIGGCKKEKPVDTPQPEDKEIVPEVVAPVNPADDPGKALDPKDLEVVMKDLESNPELSEKFAKIVEESGLQTGGQTTCPVMDGQINKDIFVEYQGKKVYFCCETCKTDFNADPAKYLSNLPQFKK